MNGAPKTILVFAATLLAVLLVLFVGEAMTGEAFSNEVMWHGNLGGGNWM